MQLLGWAQPLPEYLIDAIGAGDVKVVNVTDKKFGTYQLLQGQAFDPKAGYLKVFK